MTQLHCVGYRFCDVTLSVRAPRAAVIDDFDRAYGAFRCAGEARLDCRVDTDAGGRGRVVADGLVTEIPMADPHSEYAKWLVFEAAVAASETHLFLHASSVLTDGRALLFIAPTGHGKSTLARALAEACAAPHNDDVTPLEIASGNAGRFPKGEPQATGFREQQFPVAALFFLSPRGSGERLRLAVDRLPLGLEVGVSASADRGLRVRRCGEHWEVTMEGERADAWRAFREYCAATGVTILQDLDAAEPLFAATPQLRPCPPHQAALWLAANTFGRGGRRPDELVWQALAGLSDARFWELVPGPPAATAQHVLGVMDAATTGA